MLDYSIHDPAGKFPLAQPPPTDPAELPRHIVQRGNSRQACSVADEDYRCYLDCLKEHAGKTGCRIHAGALMNAPGQGDGQYANRAGGHTGSLREGHFRSCLTQEEGYLLACQGSIELDRVRAGMVGHPADCPWSSPRVHAQGERSPRIDAPPLCLALGADPAARLPACRIRGLEGIARAFPAGDAGQVGRSARIRGSGARGFVLSRSAGKPWYAAGTRCPLSWLSCRVAERSGSRSAPPRDP